MATDRASFGSFLFRAARGQQPHAGAELGLNVQHPLAPSTAQVCSGQLSRRAYPQLAQLLLSHADGHCGVRALVGSTPIITAATELPLMHSDEDKDRGRHA
jgi:hypothetical protein